MITNCPVCGKAFDVLWADLWRYRRDGRYICSYGCLRQIDGEDIEMNKFTIEQKQEAIRIALDGGDPKAYLKSIGSSAPDKLWSYMKTQLLKKDPETYEKLAGSRKRSDDQPASEFVPANVKLGGAIRIQTAEGETVKVISTPETPKAVNKPGKPLQYDGYTVRCIEGQYGKFYWDYEYNRLDWTSPEGEEVSLSPQGWTTFCTEIMPKVMAILGVSL